MIIDFKSNTAYVSQKFYDQLLKLCENDRNKIPFNIVVDRNLPMYIQVGSMVDVSKVEERLNREGPRL